MSQSAVLDALTLVLRTARDDLTEHVKPRDATETAIVNSLGECSWNECVSAIQRYRDKPAEPPK